MKQFFWILCVAVIAVSSVAAQEPASSPEITQEQLDELVDILRANLRAEKTRWIERSVPLTAEQAEVFWPLYRRYEMDRTRVGNEWLANVGDYADNYENLTEAKAKEIVDRYFEIEMEMLEVESRHKDEMAKHLPATVVARFFQVERRINLLIDLEAATQIPLVQ